MVRWLNLKIFHGYHMLIAGVDEVGRGPWAGPVLAAAVILDPEHPIEGLRDSKVLSSKKRTFFCEIIKSSALSWAIGSASVEEIDRFNILQATLMAMQRAIDGLAIKPDRIKVDGKILPKINASMEAIVDGDVTVPAISAASIVAKVTRDLLMIKYDSGYPGYGFGKHKGYGTAEHFDAIRRLGITPIHRRSFSPIKKFLSAGNIFQKN